jgi:RNA polymerase sigma-70 factor (ECF subfamily)
MSPIPFDVELQLRRHGSALRSLAGELVRDPWVADDAVQEVWLGALRRPPAHGSAAGGWLATALRNVVRGLCRKQRRGERRERAVADARGAVVEDHSAVLAREEQAQRLLAAVRTLPPPFRHAIWQRYFEGKAPREIAAASGVPCATVKSRLQRGLQQLRERLVNDGDAGWRGALAVAFGWQSTAAGPGVLLMTTGTKVMAGAALAAAGVLWWSFADRGVAAPAPAAVVVAETGHAAEPLSRDAGAPPDERTLLLPDAQPAAPTTREVRARMKPAPRCPAPRSGS